MNQNGTARGGGAKGSIRGRLGAVRGARVGGQGPNIPALAASATPQKQQNARQQNNRQQNNRHQNARPYQDKIKMEVNQNMSGPQLDLAPLSTAEKKFNAHSRLFVGNLSRDMPVEELTGLFDKHGELGQVYLNKENSYAFINFDYRSNAEKAKRELDGTVNRGRPMKIRFAAITTGVRVKNLSSGVSNELLEKSFSVFGQVESCRVIVDDHGKSTGEGTVVFIDKKGAGIALKKCTEECYFVTASLRPVIVEPLESRDEEDGLPEASMLKNDHYRRERMSGPRFANTNSFEFEFGLRYKRLYQMYKEKKALLDNDLKAELDVLEKRMAFARHEHETEQLRRELAAREAERAQFAQQMHGYTDSFMQQDSSDARNGGYDNYSGTGFGAGAINARLGPLGMERMETVTQPFV